MKPWLISLLLLTGWACLRADTATLNNFRLSTGKGTGGALEWRCDYSAQFKPSAPRGYRPWLEFECVLVNSAGAFDRQSGIAFPWLPDEHDVVDFARMRTLANGKADGRWSGHEGKRVAAYRAVISQKQADGSVLTIATGPSTVAPGFEQKIPAEWWDRSKFTAEMQPVPRP